MSHASTISSSFACALCLQFINPIYALLVGCDIDIGHHGRTLLLWLGESNTLERIPTTFLFASALPRSQILFVSCLLLRLLCTANRLSSFSTCYYTFFYYSLQTTLYSHFFLLIRNPHAVFSCCSYCCFQQVFTYTFESELFFCFAFLRNAVFIGDEITELTFSSAEYSSSRNEFSTCPSETIAFCVFDTVNGKYLRNFT